MILLKPSTGILLSLESLSKSLVEDMEATLASAAIIVMAVDILFAVMGCSRRSDTLATESLGWGGADTGRYLVRNGNGGEAGLDFERLEARLTTDMAAVLSSVSVKHLVDFFFCLGCLSWEQVLHAIGVAFVVGKKGRREN